MKVIRFFSVGRVFFFIVIDNSAILWYVYAATIVTVVNIFLRGTKKLVREIHYKKK